MAEQHLRCIDLLQLRIHHCCLTLALSVTSCRVSGMSQIITRSSSALHLHHMDRAGEFATTGKWGGRVELILPAPSVTLA
jgi:hypothetical protein